MQTIAEYQEYTAQLENEVGRWHHAYDALMIERNQMVKTLCENKKIIETMAAELDELRKHEVEWDLAKARIKELEQLNKTTEDK
jgi:septal ring factor EnvC (AmiA/AmiB activator)